MSVYFSFNDWPGLQAVPLKFVGFKNYSNLFHNAVFLKSFAECSYLRCCKCYFAGSYWIWTWITDPSFQKKDRDFFKAAFFISYDFISDSSSIVYGILFIFLLTREF